MKSSVSLGRDLLECTQYVNFWLSSALYNYSATKKRYVLGYFHQPLSTLVLALFLTFFLSSVFNEQAESYFFYVLFGLASWNFTSGIVIGAFDSIYKAKGVLKQIYLPFSAVVLKSIVISCIGFVVELLVLSAVYMLYTGDFSPLVLYPLVIAILSVTIACTIISVLVAYFGNLLPDLSLLIPTVMRGAFFITPIFWYIEDVSPEKQQYMDFNPFYAFVTIVRVAVIEGQCDTASLLRIVTISAAGLLLILVCRFDRNRVIGKM